MGEDGGGLGIVVDGEFKFYSVIWVVGLIWREGGIVYESKLDVIICCDFLGFEKVCFGVFYNLI